MKTVQDDFERRYPAIKTMRYYSRFNNNTQTLSKPKWWQRLWSRLTRRKRFRRHHLLISGSSSGSFVELDFRRMKGEN